MKIFKKIGMLFVNFFMGIMNLVDKLLVTPISKWFFRIRENLTKNNQTLEYVLYRTNALIFLSLILSLLLFFIIDSKVISITNSNAEVFANQPVIAEYNQEEYAIEGIPKTVTVTMIGKSSDLYLAKQLPVNKIKVDLTDLKEGTHRVTIKYNQSIGNIRYMVDPSVVTVNVYQKQSITKSVGTDILNQDDLDPKLVIKKVELSKDEVLLKGPQYKLDKVATVKALIDIKDLSNQSVGTIKMAEVPLVAYDKNGVRVRVNIVPSKVNADLEIVSPSKEVPIKVIPTGKLVFGKAISTLQTSVKNVVIYGDDAILEDINFVPVKVDVNGLNRDKEYNVAIRKPVGVRSMSAKNTTVKVTLGTESTKLVDGIAITYQNLAAGKVVQAASAKDINVTIIVKGDKTILDKIDPVGIKAYIDLKGYEAGTHSVPVKVTGDDPRLIYQAKTKKITLTITNS